MYNPSKKLTPSVTTHERHLMSADIDSKNDIISIKNPLSQMIMAEDCTILLPLNPNVKSKVASYGSSTLQRNGAAVISIQNLKQRTVLPMITNSQRSQPNASIPLFAEP